MGGLRKSLNLTSMNLKLPSTMQIRPTVRVKKPLRGIRPTSGTPFSPLKMRLALAKRSWKLLVSLKEKLMPLVEESRALLDSADRTKRQIDTELADARNAVNEMQVINSKAMHEKRNVESMIHTLQAEIDDMLAQAKNSEEKSKRAMVDAARLADELRSEQDHANAEARGKRTLDSQLAELDSRLSDAEAAAMKGGKNAMSKLEMKIH